MKLLAIVINCLTKKSQRVHCGDDVEDVEGLVDGVDIGDDD